MDIFEGLSEDKIPPIKKIKGPCLVLAGAGTGKTKTIIAKIAYLIDKGVKEERILCLTFSNNAASSLKEKISKLLGREALCTASTFHGFCHEILKKHGEKIGIPYGFNLINETDAAMILFKNNLEPKQAKHYASSIIKAKDLNIKLSDYKGLLKKLKKDLESISPNANSWEEEFIEKRIELKTLGSMNLDRKEKSGKKKELNDFLDSYSRIMELNDFIINWEHYENHKEKNGMLDFSDLNLKVLELLEESDEGFLSKDYDYLIVDEFQDTSHVQFELIKKMANKDFDITVVGDANQTIYAFRGAFTDNIGEFRKEFKLKKSDEFILDKNFRSSQSILDASHALIKNNYEDESEAFKLKSSFSEKKIPKIMQCISGEEEARRIVEIIDEKSKEMPLSDICVLYRSHSQGAMAKRFLEKRGYPLNICGGTDIFKSPEIKNAMSFFEIMANFEKPYFRASQAWWRLLHKGRFLDSKDSIVLAEYLKKSKKSIQNVLYNELEKTGMSIDSKNAINDFKSQIEELMKIRDLSASEMVLKSYKLLGIIDEIKLRDDFESKKALLDLKDFYNIAKEFEKNHSKDIVDFMDYLRLIDELELEIKASEIENENSLNLMTIHASKGLEFKSVIIANMAKGKFPLVQGGKEALIPHELHPQLKELMADNPNDLQDKIREKKAELKLKDERKLAYVAMTRAMNDLIMTYALQYEGSKNEKSESQFLTEIKDFCEFEMDEKISGKFLVDDTELDRYMHFLKKEFFKSLDESSYNELLKKLIIYKSLKDKSLLKSLKSDEKKEIEKIHEKIFETMNKKPVFNPEKLKISFSSLSTYAVCPKKFELDKILSMPKIWEEKSSHAMLRGSFVHKILEEGAKRKIKSKQELYGLKDELKKIDDFKGLDLNGVDECLEVFWARNPKIFSKTIFSEEKFEFKHEGFIFTGFIDRVDLIGENEISIIDYKTGNAPDLDKTFLQLGMYAFAAKHYPKLKKYFAKKLSLQLLEQESDKSYEINEGIMSLESGRGSKQSLQEIEDKILELANGIKNDFSNGFKRLGSSRDCESCEFRFYCK